MLALVKRLIDRSLEIDRAPRAMGRENSDFRSRKEQKKGGKNRLSGMERREKTREKWRGSGRRGRSGKNMMCSET